MSNFCVLHSVLVTIISLSVLVHSAPLESLDIKNVWEILKRMQRLDSLKKSKAKTVKTTTQPMQTQLVDEEGFLSNVNFNDFTNLLSKIKPSKLRESEQVESGEIVDLLDILQQKTPKDLLRFIPNLPYLEKRLKKKEVTESEENIAEEPAFNADDYSKVFVILDPKALSKISDKKELRGIVSQLIKQKTKENLSEEPPEPPKFRYKGFLVNAPAIRRRRAEEIMNRHRRQIEGTGMRTGIPFLNYKGDIYEHDDEDGMKKSLRQ